MPKKHLVLAECIVGEIDQLKNKRAWIQIMPIPFVEVETAWARVSALTCAGGNEVKRNLSVRWKTQKCSI